MRCAGRPGRRAAGQFGSPGSSERAASAPRRSWADTPVGQDGDAILGPETPCLDAALPAAASRPQPVSPELLAPAASLTAGAGRAAPMRTATAAAVAAEADRRIQALEAKLQTFEAQVAQRFTNLEDQVRQQSTAVDGIKEVVEASSRRTDAQFEELLRRLTPQPAAQVELAEPKRE